MGQATNAAIDKAGGALELFVDLDSPAHREVIVEGRVRVPQGAACTIGLECDASPIAPLAGRAVLDSSNSATFYFVVPCPPTADLATVRIVARRSEGSDVPLAFLFFHPIRSVQQPFLKQESDEEDTIFSPVDRAVARLVRDWQMPGATLAIGYCGRISHKRSFGWADVAAGDPMSAASRQRLGSLTKPITAAAILMLARDRKIGLDTLLSAYLPWPAKLGTAPTVRHLLHNASGLEGPDDRIMCHIDGLTKDECVGAAAPVASGRVAEALRGVTVRAAPATSFDYQPFNYWCLGRIIEAVSGVGYARFVRERVLRPLDLEDRIVFGGSFPDRRALGEIGLKEGETLAPAPAWAGVAGTWPVAYGDALSGRDSSGGLVASALDSNFLFQHLHDIEPVILHVDDLAALTHHVATRTTSAPGWHYGAGLFVERASGASSTASEAGGIRWWHFGSLAGSVGIVYRDRGVITTLLFNGRPKGWRLLLATLLGVVRKHTPSREALIDARL